MLALRIKSSIKHSPNLIRTLLTAPAPTLHPTDSGLRPPHLLTLADLSVAQIQSLVSHAIALKQHYKYNEVPIAGRSIHGIREDALQKDVAGGLENGLGDKSLKDKTVALIFSKRSTRTRVASETSIKLLGKQLIPNFVVDSFFMFLFFILEKNLILVKYCGTSDESACMKY